MEKPSVIFLAIPDSFHELSDFGADPAIPLPVELKDEEGNPETAAITKEAVISGMLRVISSKGQNYLETKLRPEWVDYYRRLVLAVKPEIFHEFTVAAIVKTRNGEFDLALEINSILEGLFPNSPGVLLNKALILEEKAASLEKNGHEAVKENTEALEAYESALAIEPLLPDTLFNAGFFFIRVREFEKARECFSRYISIDDKSEIPLPTSDEKKKQAQKILKDINSQFLGDSCFQEAYQCVNSGNAEQGMKKIREFIERHPMVWNGWFVLGWALRKLGRYSDGLEALEKAIELGASGIDIQNEMAICFMEQGDMKSAKKELEKALRKEPENIKIISNLGVLAMKTGKKEEAAAFFRTVLELDPEDSLAKHFYEHLS